ncbi:ABC transporter permease [Microbacter margulisiae]|uniref:Lipoprotein-releasing system permease protein n=1 Tax=Microbacter margulisiae TaxID=1350067 RepID=A0A7W5H1W0_9PORP|nr:FtsX-like permease family protein [Microbacter margulisiae]MBB3186782.1 lipoprotein-releasing system permease protein [Microbacter margulisiae]
MNLPYFIAKRIHFTDDGKRRVSRPAVRIATIGIAVGLLVMMLTIAIVMGFKKEIRTKIVGFGSSIQVMRFDNNSTYETRPIAVSDSMIASLTHLPGIRHVQRVASKPGIIKTPDQFQGVIFKGVGSDFDWHFFQQNMISGSRFKEQDSLPSNQVVISKVIANKLGLKVGSSFIAYFLQNRLQARKFYVAGIYSTDFGDFDNLYILCDIRMIQALNDWQPDEISELELSINNFDQLNAISDTVYFHVANRVDRNGVAYYSQSIKDLNPQLFAWLGLFDMNVWVILILMMAVSGFVIISGLLILILERIQMIGILKALGCTNWDIRKIFIYHSGFLILKGMFWGNLLALTFIIVQHTTGLIPLDPANYYVSSVPVELRLAPFLLLNISVFLVSMFMLVAPSYLITKISPVSAIRYE